MTTEFDAFGPWIDEVRTTGDLPRLYRDAGVDPAVHRLVLKVPRDIERRNADPAMHLYDYLLALDEEYLTVLHRRGDTYDTSRVPLDRVAAIEDSVRLLNGRLVIHTVDGAATEVAYNGSANAPIRKLITAIRKWYLPETPPADDVPAPPLPRLGRADTGLLTDWRHLMRQEPGLRLFTVAEQLTVTPSRGWERLYRKVWPLTLHASISVTDDREIQVLHRRDWFTPGGDELSLARTVLPRDRITEITVRDHLRYEGVHVLTVRSGATVLEFPMAAGPATEALRTT
ncbi:MAG TPA: hypothetical protein VN408_35190 [Actinoplanes sp.]|nr:hypothetical protein [Actinoplanes sp.]